MKKLLGIGLFLVLLYGALWAADLSGFAPNAASPTNHLRLGERIGLYGVLSLAAGILIITGGIDLSVGSVVGFCMTVMAILLVEWRWHPAAAALAVLALGALIGLVNGLIVTYLRVQAFVVTLCGLFIYRGAARWVANDRQLGLGEEFAGLKAFLNGNIAGVPTYLVILLGLALLATVFLHLSVYGRYLYAIGSNETAARYSGIATHRYKILAYVLCSGLAALFAIFFLMWQNQVQPSTTGNFLELYAIAGAVLGGYSLRGGEGIVLGILIGTAILRLLPNMINMFGVSSALEPAVIGLALLLGAILDEYLRSGRRVRA